MMKVALKIIRDTAIIVAITLSLLLLIELALRFFFPADSFQAEKISYRYDSTLLIALCPSIDRIYTRDQVDGGQTITWRINREGFRHGPMQKGKRRIMVYGDSNIQGVFSWDDSTYCARLENHAEALCGEEVEVINAGIVGYGPDQALLKFEREANQFNPDDVVFVIFGHNDFGDLIRNRLFMLDADSNLRLTRHPREMDPLLRKPGFFDHIRIFDMVSFMRDKLGLNDPHDSQQVSDLTIAQYEKLCAEQFYNYQAGGPNIYSHFFDNYDIDVSTRPSAESSKVKIRLMAEVMRRIREVALKHGIRLWFVALPSAIDVTENRPISSADLERFPEYHPQNLTEPIVTAGKALEVPTLDLYALFREKESSGLYFSGEFNDHWTDYGQDLAARSTAEMICPATGR